MTLCQTCSREIPFGEFCSEPCAMRFDRAQFRPSIPDLVLGAVMAGPISPRDLEKLPILIEDMDEEQRKQVIRVAMYQLQDAGIIVFDANLKLILKEKP